MQHDRRELPVIADAVDQAVELVFRHGREELAKIMYFEVCCFVGHDIPLNGWGRREAPPMVLANFWEIPGKVPCEDSFARTHLSTESIPCLNKQSVAHSLM